MNARGFGQYSYLVYALPIIRNAKIVVETGLSNGESTKMFLDALSLMEGERELHTYEIDINQNACQEAIRYINNQHYKDYWHLHHQNSIDGGKTWNTNKKIDLLFLDSDHRTDFVFKELEAWVPNLAPNAVIVGDDVWLSRENKSDMAYGGFREY
ncbi:MAG: class I SAM-dependent methyltransferase, partial [Firmicutes bacterium]|nr:class I SAM-dependent methyltransferase [Bacillota bacterium]